MAEEMRIVLRNYGKIDPLKIDDYIAVGGYNALNKARSMDQADLINEVRVSNLRGRGGAGFNCGVKWNFACMAQADQKYGKIEGSPARHGTVLEPGPGAIGHRVCIGS